MVKQVPVDTAAIIAASEKGGRSREILPDLAYKRLAIVNVCFYGRRGAGDRGWVLIDTGLAGTAVFIRNAASDRFGKASRPAAIILTHAHFDHVGAAEWLARIWDAPVFAHELELEHLNGSASYPKPDPSVGGGLMARLSLLYPRGPVNLGARVHALPPEGDVPGMPGWRWIHTPGHCRGHVSLYRDVDRSLIAGDAFITTNQESAYAVLTQEPELHGPPQYYTENWEEARESVKRLAALKPELALCGHGRPMQGSMLTNALTHLAAHFNQLAVPKDGKYVAHPPRAANY